MQRYSIFFISNSFLREVLDFFSDYTLANLNYIGMNTRKSSHLVKTYSKNGLTREIAYRIIEILKGEMNKKH